MAINRYEFSTKHVKREKGECYNTTILPKLEKTFDDRFIFTIEGDRLDLLAHEFYGDSRHWTILANANNLGKGTLSIPAGTQLRIPPDTVIQELRERIENAEKDR